MMSRVLSTARGAQRYALDVLKNPASKRSRYQLPSGYRQRRESTYYDDTINADEWQREVYLTTAKIAADNGLETVYDIGCGSGYKLVKYLGDFDTTGYDVEATVLFLKTTYPDRKWEQIPSPDQPLPQADLVICSDVIEHVDNPDALCDLLKKTTRSHLVLSTPSRDLLYGKTNPRRRGPPSNAAHLREWSFSEFKDYISRTFDVLEHRITNARQCTQMIVCRNKV